jgi:hypothetical protein
VCFYKPWSGFEHLPYTVSPIKGCSLRKKNSLQGISVHLPSLLQNKSNWNSLMFCPWAISPDLPGDIGARPECKRKSKLFSKVVRIDVLPAF